jgi:hypothetical protein
MIIIITVNCRIYQNFITGFSVLFLHTYFTRYFECTVYNARFKNQNFWSDSCTYKYSLIVSLDTFTSYLFGIYVLVKIIISFL